MAWGEMWPFTETNTFLEKALRVRKANPQMGSDS